jgi:TetR/AcrR family transcriptional regulator, ethionamide resistance regulator
MSEPQTRRQVAADGRMLDFAASLLAVADNTGLRKVERTRLRLLASMATALMSGVERADLKVADVTRGAGLAHGTFYRYFTDMRMATDALIEEFSTFVQEKIASAREGETGSRARVHGATLLYTRLFRRNAGLMRCLISLTGETTSFARSYQRLNRDWYGRVAAAIAKRRGQEKSRHDFLPAAYALGGMIDEFLTQVYLRKDPALTHLAGEEEKIADLLTDLWCFGAYGAERPGIARSE